MSSRAAIRLDVESMRPDQTGTSRKSWSETFGTSSKFGCTSHKTEKAALPENFPNHEFESSSRRSSEIPDCQLDEGATTPTSSRQQSTVTEQYTKEKLFVMCHGCARVLMIRFGEEFDLTQLATVMRPDLSTIVLTTCKSCSLSRVRHASDYELVTQEFEKMFNLLRLNRKLIEQTYAYQVIRMVSQVPVIVVVYNDGIYYQRWNAISQGLPENCVCRSIDTDGEHGQIRDRLIMPYVSGAFM